MARLNLTLDAETFSQLDRDARRERVRLATHARRLLREALARRAQGERDQRWALAYRAGRADARQHARDMDAAQLDVMGDEQTE